MSEQPETGSEPKPKLQDVLQSIYDSVKDNKDGKTAEYIPQLKDVNPDYFGISVCTVDGKTYNFGDTSVPFTLQSCSKPLSYCVAYDLYGLDYIHDYIGFEPSGAEFNAHILDRDNKPHNVMINTGAMVIISLLKPELDASQRYDIIMDYYSRMSGLGSGKRLGFNNSIFLSERDNADRNISLAYFMREKGALPKKTDHSIIMADLNLYFQCCSISANCKQAAVIAATLANGGKCPTTKEQVFSSEAARDCLSLMYNCGMYDYTGQFSFRVGLPAKSGVSGCVMLVVPGKYGICIYSPPLDRNGNSVRGVEVCKRISTELNEHMFHKWFHKV